MANYGGLLGNLSPLTQFGFGLLAQSGPSLTPQSPWQAIGRAGMYMSEAQQQQMQNELIRQKLLESQRETQGQTALAEAVASGALPLPSGMKPEAAAALFKAYPEGATKAYLGTQFPQALTPSDQIALAKLGLDITKLKAETEKTTQATKAATGETLSQTTQTLGNIKSVGEISQRLENSPLFAPGGPVDQFGVGPAV